LATWKKLVYEDDAILKSLLTEQGDIIYASAASTPAVLPHGTSTQYLKSGGDGANPSWDTPAGGGATIVRKTADEIVNNSTTLQNDDHLLLAVGANEVWSFFAYLKVISQTGTPDIKFDWSLPTGGVIQSLPHDDIAVLAANTPIAPIGAGTNFTFALPANSERIALVWGLYVGGANAGNVQLQWAQITATAEDTKVLANSFLIAHKIG